MSLSPERLERRRRHALMRIRQMKREGLGSAVQFIKGRTPGGPKFKGSQWIRPLFAQALFRGRFPQIQICDALGNVKSQMACFNDITNEGLNKVLDILFDDDAKISTWYIGLIDNLNFTALADDDLYDDINQAGNGWDEYTNYTDANNADSAVTRPVWPTDAASGQSITNATTQAIYDITTASGNLRGAFVAGGPQALTKGDHTAGNTLWATAEFTGAPVSVDIGDQIKITYTVNASHP